MRQYRYVLPESGTEVLLTFWENEDAPFGQDMEFAVRPAGARRWSPPLEPESVVET